MEFSLIGITASPELIALIGFFCVGAVKLVDSLFARDFASALKIVVSAIVGALVAFVSPDVDVLDGIAIGIAASGAVTMASRFAKDSSTSLS